MRTLSASSSEFRAAPSARDAGADATAQRGPVQ
jgi:hypothetical protein